MDENKQAEPVAWQFYDEASGRWCNGLEVNNHRKNTEAAGIKTRDLSPQPPTEVVRELMEAYDSTRMALQMFSATFDKCGFVPSEATKNLVDKALQNIESAILKAKEHGL